MGTQKLLEKCKFVQDLWRAIAPLRPILFLEMSESCTLM